MADGDQSKDNCKICNNLVADDEEGVECESCLCWYHFVCAGVGEEIETEKWFCQSCQANAEMNVSQDQASTLVEVPEDELREIKDLIKKTKDELERMNLENSKLKAENKLLSAKVGDSKRPDSGVLSELLSEFRDLKEQIKVKGSDHDKSCQSPQKVVIESKSPVFSLQDNEARKSRKYLQDLPVFDGNVNRWAEFITVFEETTIAGRFTETENKARLVKCLKGNAAQLVSHLLKFSNKSSLIIDELKKVYGRKEVFSVCLIRDLLKFPEIKSEKDPKLREFTIEVLNLVESMKALDRHQDLNNEFVLSQLELKLASAHYREWQRLKRSIQLSKCDANLDDFGKFLNEISGELPVLELALKYSDISRLTTDNPVKRINTHQESSSSSNVLSCYKCNEHHTLKRCHHFLKEKPSQRWEFIMNNKICSCCLIKSKHDFKNCEKKRRCAINGCNGFHHRLLHKDSRIISGENDNKLSIDAPVFQPQPETSKSAEASISINNHRQRTNSMLYKIVPVKIYGQNKNVWIETYALFDDGSGVTIIEEDFLHNLGIEGESEVLNLQWTNNIQRTEESKRVNVTLSSIHDSTSIVLENVYSVKNLNLSKQSFNYSEMKKKFPHLCGLNLSNQDNIQPKLLIGLPHARYMKLERHKVSSDINAPIAAKSCFGWLVYGPSTPTVGIQVSSLNYNQTVRLSYHEATKAEPDLHDLVKGYFTTENFGVAPKNNLISKNEQRAIQIMNDTLSYSIKDHQYEIGLLWKADNLLLPESRSMAVKRLITEEKSLVKRELLEWKINHIKEQKEKNYVRVANKTDLDSDWGKVWYCPRFVVINENKLPRKPRDVCDVAAKVNGISLNSCLLKGPDNLAPLLRGLCKLRENPIAFNADVKEMYHQIKIIEKDQQCQRFLWRNEKGEIIDYIMQVMMFGPTCSPSCSQFVKNHHANKFAIELPKAAKSLTEDTYVDDVFGSEATVEEAEILCKELIAICKLCHFDLVAFQSNSKELLSKLPIINVKKDLIELNEVTDDKFITKVLGMYWEAVEDKFIFMLKRDDNFDQILIDECPTKRKMLKFIMKIFDPLGLIAVITIQGKLILQRVWMSGTDWDDPISEDLRKRWRDFVDAILQIEQIKLSRCYAPVDINKFKVQLVVFVDASEQAFVATAYLRFSSGSEIYVSHVMSKAKVAPLKRLSVPQLELQAAVLGARMSDSIKKLHSFKIDETKLLSDSRTVLCWINSKEFNFKSFVAVRISEILDLTTQSQWYFINSKFNVADDATRWKGKMKINSDDRWFVGAPFLQLQEEYWPIKKGNQLSSEVNRVEESQSINFHKNISSMYGIVDQIGSKFKAKWFSLVRVVGYILRWKNRRLKNHCNTTFLVYEEIMEAELVLFKKIQHEIYFETITKLRGSRKKDCEREIRGNCDENLQNLSPFLDDKEMIRMSSRNQIDKYSYAMRNPIILPNKHWLVDLLVQDIHERNYHRNDSVTISDLRERVWIIHIRKALKRVKFNCQYCKLQKVKPFSPRMGNLPEFRLDFGCKPFTHVGLDAFGPYEVKFGRSTVKRYGIIFTCLTYRAIHVELCKDLSSDCCLLSIRNFIAVRGQAQHFYSDNGKNFVGAENVLKRHLLNMKNQLGGILVNSYKIDWHFQPAYSPWFGGAWERLIGSIKRCLEYLLKNEIPKEEVLETALKEIAFMINRRPLTHEPALPEESTPLTPNSILFGDIAFEKSYPLGVFDEKDKFSRKSYNRAQMLTQKFGHRWIREYLPEIIKREKWGANDKSIELDDIVMVIEPNECREYWKRGRVIKLYQGKDDVVRVVDIQLSNGKIQRSRAIRNLINLTPAIKSSVPEVTRVEVCRRSTRQ